MLIWGQKTSISRGQENPKWKKSNLSTSNHSIPPSWRSGCIQTHLKRTPKTKKRREIWPHLHGKSVHIRSYCDKRRLAASHVSHNACNGNWVLVRDAQGIEFASNHLTGLKFLKTKFWVLMDSPPDIHHPLEKVWSFCAIEEIQWYFWGPFWACWWIWEGGKEEEEEAKSDPSAKTHVFSFFFFSFSG